MQPPFASYDVRTAFANQADFVACMTQWTSRGGQPFGPSTATSRGPNFPATTVAELLRYNVPGLTTQAMRATVWSDFTYNNSQAPQAPAVALETPHDYVHGTYMLFI
jgi:hypothetical protein